VRETIPEDASVETATGGAHPEDQPISVKRLVQNVWREIGTDNVTGLAAQMAYYFVLALFPFLIFLAALVGMLPFTGLWERVLQWITVYFPQSSQRFVFETVTGLTRGSGNFLSIGMLGTTWAASVGLLSLMNSLNAAYEVEETRNVFKRTAITLLMVFVLAGCFLGSVALLAVGDWLNDWLITQMGFTALLLALWHGGRWLVSLWLLATGIAIVDYVLPDLKRSWRWITPGTAFAVLAWLPVTLVFDLYTRYVGSYDKTYGALASLAMLMGWIYLMGLITLIGAEINSELWKMRTKPGVPQRERPEAVWGNSPVVLHPGN